MKQALFLILALLLCLWMCSCSKEAPSATPTTAVTNGSKKLKEPLTVESLAGTYKSRLWFLDHTITLNADSTYILGNDEEGTFILEDKYITFDSEDSSITKNYIAGNDCIYTFESWHFDADEASGVTFSPDQNGFTDQSFEGHTPGGNIPGSHYNWIFLDLNADGTFTLKLGSKGTSSLDVAETFEGTYISKNATLLLTYNGQDYPLIMNNANYTFFLIYDKG